MVFVTDGLTNGGFTNHYSFQYDKSLQKTALNSGGQEPVRTNQVIAAAEADFNQMTAWFGGIALDVNFPIIVNVTPNGGGARWNLNSGNLIVTINPNASGSASFIRYLIVAEIVEQFMRAQNLGWYGSGTEGSQGEGLSRFLAAQFLEINGLSSTPSGFTNSNNWLSSTRADFVNNIRGSDDGPDDVTGCSLLFIYYLFSQLNFGINAIVAAGALSLGAVYRKLTGNTDDPFPAFKSLVDTYFPGTSNISCGDLDNPFPLGIPFRLAKNMAISRIPNHLDVFWVGPDGGVGTAWWDQNANDGKWNPPFPIAPPGSAVAGAITCVSRIPNHLDVFWVGPDGGVGTAWWDQNANDGKWNPPFPIAPPGSAVAGAITCVSRIPNHLDVFWVGPDGGVGTAWWDQNANDGKWNPPFPIAPPGSAVAGAITCVSRIPNHLDVFWVGPDGGVGTAWWDQNANAGKWNLPFSIAQTGSASGRAITCVARSQNHLDVFWVGPDGGVGTAWWDQNANAGKWNLPFSIAQTGSASGRAITCVARSQNHLDVFWVGPDGGVGTAWWDQNANAGKWNLPFPIAPPSSASGRAIYAVSRIPNHLDVFWVGPDGGVGTAWWDQNANAGKWNLPFSIAPPGSAVA